MLSLSFHPLLRHRLIPSLSPPPAAVSIPRPVVATSREAHRTPKNFLKVKDLSSLATTMEPSAPLTLLPNQAIGLVVASQANFMRVIVQSASGPPENPSPSASDVRSGREILCVVRALLKKIRRRVMVGDKVLVGSIDWVDRRGMIEDVFGRRSEILDPPLANVEHLLLLFSFEQPKLEPFTLTRFLVEAESVEIPFTLALNKAELVGDEILSAWKDRLEGWGYKPLFCSVESKFGLAALEDILEGQTNVIVGPSGVGKSRLINSLRGRSHEEEVDYLPHHHKDGSKWSGDQRVGTVSERSGKGKHTTRHVSLLAISGGGYLADTPGFNLPSLLKVTKRNLPETFPEIRQMINSSEHSRCSFNDCLHIGEPGCIVKANWERYPYYLQLLDEIKIREEFQLRTIGTKREGDMRYNKMGGMGAKQPEPRLELKKHRRISRKRLNQSILDDVDDDDDDDDDVDDDVDDDEDDDGAVIECAR